MAGNMVWQAARYGYGMQRVWVWVWVWQVWVWVWQQGMGMECRGSGYGYGYGYGRYGYGYGYGYGRYGYGYGRYGYGMQRVMVGDMVWQAARRGSADRTVFASADHHCLGEEVSWKHTTLMQSQLGEKLDVRA